MQPTVRQLIARLQGLVEEGFGDTQVYLTTNDVDTSELIKGRFIALDQHLEE